MSTRFASSFMALLLGLCLHASSALAQLSVTATQDSGAPGTDVNVALTVSAAGASDEVDLSAISTYTFNLLWDASVLSWNSSSAVGLTAPTHVANDGFGIGSLVFAWSDSDPFINPVSFAGGLSIATNFHILNTAAYGASTIAFGDGLSSSVLMDVAGGFYSFSDVTLGNPMQVTVTPIPEPAEVSMLMAGLGIMALVLRRRRTKG